ncbi:MAG: hypothetical protein CMK32_10455 [Porticoccaceae bacterium]|nr:hypothetical protein [Porticoccaceae bacterium]
MYTDENYLWGMVAYGLGCLLLLPPAWIISRRIIPWRIPRNSLRILLLAVLFTPVRAYTDMHFLAPAWVVMAFEFVQPTTPEGPVRALMPLLSVFLGLLVVYLLFTLLRRLLPGNRQKRRPNPGPRASTV